MRRKYKKRKKKSGTIHSRQQSVLNWIIVAESTVVEPKNLFVRSRCVLRSRCAHTAWSGWMPLHCSQREHTRKHKQNIHCNDARAHATATHCNAHDRRRSRVRVFVYASMRHAAPHVSKAFISGKSKNVLDLAGEISFGFSVVARAPSECVREENFDSMPIATALWLSCYSPSDEFSWFAFIYTILSVKFSSALPSIQIYIWLRCV